MEWLNYLVLGLFAAGMVAIAVFTRKRSKTTDDFLLGKRKTNGWLSAFAYGTTYFSAVIFIGYAGTSGRDFGLSAIWIGVGNAILGSLVAWLVLAKRTRKITHELNVKTMPEFFEKRYDSKYIKLISAALIFIFLVPYSASVYQGLASLFETVLGIPFEAVVIVMAALTALYVFFGGYTATVISDFIQGIIMIIGVAIMIIFVFRAPGIDSVASSFGKLVDAEKGFGNFSIALVCLILLTSLGSWGLPQMVHKFYAVKDEKAIKQATVVSTLFALIIGVGAYAVGAVATLATGMSADIINKNPDQIIPTLLNQAMLPGLLGLIAVLVLSASMSTLSGLAMTSSSAVSIDLYKGYINKRATDKNVNWVLRILSIVFIAVSAVIAILRPASILNLMSLSWGLVAGAFIGPYVLGIYFKDSLNKYGAYASMISSSVISIVLYVLRTAAGVSLFSAPFIGVCCILFSFIVTPAVSLIFKNKAKQDAERKAAKAAESIAGNTAEKPAETAV